MQGSPEPVSLIADLTNIVLPDGVAILPYNPSVVLVADAFVEEELLDAQGGRLQGKVYGPERRTSGIANSRRAVAGDTVRLAAGRRQHPAPGRTTYDQSGRHTRGRM